MENSTRKTGGMKPLVWIRDKLPQIGVVLGLLAVWQLAAMQIDVPLIWPSVPELWSGVTQSVTDPEVMKNFGITLLRVLKGWGIALLVGIPLGLAMGLSATFDKMFGGIIHSLRQVPMMAWVPLTIIWFGIGDGPTLFMIALNGVFQVVLNTAAGVRGISRDFFFAAQSMGASKWSLFKNIVLPGAMPDILVGARLAAGGGWMSVI